MPGVTVETVAPAWSAVLGEHVQALAWDGRGDRLAAAPVTGPIAVFNAAGAQLLELDGHGAGTCAVAWSPVADLLASGGQDRGLRVVRGDGTPAFSERFERGWVEHLAWSPDGRWLAASAGRLVRIYDPEGRLRAECGPHPATVAGLAWAPRGDCLATIAYGGLWLWWPERVEDRRAYAWKGSPVALAWSADARFVAVGLQDDAVHVWRASNGQDWHMHGYAAKVRELAWDPRRPVFATGGGPDLALWDLSGSGPDGKRPTLLVGHPARVTALVAGPRPQEWASAGSDGLLLRWRNGRAVRSARFASSIAALTWRPGTDAVAVGCADGEVAVVA